MRKIKHLRTLLWVSALCMPAVTVHAQLPASFSMHMEKINKTYDQSAAVSFEVETTFFRDDELQQDATQIVYVARWGTKTYSRVGQSEYMSNELFSATANHKTHMLIIDPPRKSTRNQNNPVSTYINDSSRSAIRNVKLYQLNPEQWYYEMDLTASQYRHIKIFFNPEKWLLEHVELYYNDLLTGDPCKLHIRYFNQQMDSNPDEQLFRPERFLLQPPAKPKRKRKSKEEIPLYPAAPYKDYTFINHLT